MGASSARNNAIIKNMAYSAILMALAVVLTAYGSFNLGVSWLRIGFGSIPIVISSLVSGPIWGMLVGAGSDVIQHFLAPTGDYFFGYTIDAALEGLVPYLVVRLLKGRTKTKFTVSLLMFAFLTVIGILFVSMFTSFKKQEMPMWLRICIPFFFLLYFGLVYLMFILLDKTKAFRPAQREERRFSLSDIYLISLSIASLITVPLYSLWTGIFISKLDSFLIFAFTQILVFSVNGILRTFIVFFIMNALLKADYSLMGYLTASAKKDPQNSAASSSEEEKSPISK